jgi:thiosulfate/3-mercaptopyruvate sulfurtransferase
MTPTLPGPLVSTAWLAAHLTDPAVVVVDASWYLPAMNRNPQAEYRSGHVPGAVFWDLDALSRQDTSLPHMLPDPATFARQVGRLGIGNDSVVVVYDGSGTNLSAPRVWWELRLHGHDPVAVLDGGMAKWRAEGRTVAPGSVAREPTTFEVRVRPGLVRSLDEVRAAIGTDAQLLDARSRGRFEATEPEPRQAIRGGHVPGARSVPYGDLVTPDGTLKPPTELRRLFAAAGIDLGRPVITSCGSGVSACALALALDLAGRSDTAVYDGSWTEWGGREDTPIETGAPSEER